MGEGCVAGDAAVADEGEKAAVHGEHGLPAKGCLTPLKFYKLIKIL